jgi:hypothetical protein
MKPFLATMLASAAVCALSTAPALAAGAPNIHIAFASKGLMKVKSVGFAKTNIWQPPSKKVSTVTEHVTFTGSYTPTQFLKHPTLLWAETWYATSGGKCIQPPKQKQKFTKSTDKDWKIKTGTTTAENPCGTDTWTYWGPSFWINHIIDHIKPAWTGTLKTKKWKVNSTYYNLNLIEETAIYLQ